ncbi:hypothetical protein SAMN03159335_07868, partial [Burkholderia cepacia]
PVEVDVDSEEIELVADDKPVDVEVDSDDTVLLAELRPVDSELMPVEVDVDSEEIELVADDKPVEVDVDSEEIELVADDKPVDVEVDSVNSWPPLTASPLPAATVPFARLMILLLDTLTLLPFRMMLPGAYSSIDCPGMEPVTLELGVVALLTVIHVVDVLAPELIPGPPE